MPKVKRFLLSSTFKQPSYLRKKVIPRYLLLKVFSFFSIRVITHFGSNFLKISQIW